MGNLMASMINSSNALGVYSQALQVVENNVTNAQTPGYASQTQTFQAMPLDVPAGLAGGVAAGPVQSSRDAYLEQNVRQQQTATNFSQQQVNDLTTVENYFPTSSTATSGIGASLNSLFSSFSQLSITPNDTTQRQAVLTAANQVATSFQQTVTGLQTAASNVNSEARSTIDQVNQLASAIAQINSNHLNVNGQLDPGTDAQMTTDLEQLSQYVNITALQQPGGAINVYLGGGQTPLVLGDQAQSIQAALSNQQTSVLDSQGNDITSQITDGQLGAELTVTNTQIPSYLSSLNTLAQTVADQVNTTLSNGVDQNGNSPATNLFSYDPTVGAAQTLSVNPLTPDQIAAALPGAPGGNDNALSLSALGSAQVINGETFAGFYGSIGSQVGNDVANATNSLNTNTQRLQQAQNLRSQASGVSLDAEAARLLQLQQGYSATSRMIGILGQLTNDIINIIQPTMS
jgi:flagellar hook-associated protein 1 FlgK